MVYLLAGAADWALFILVGGLGRTLFNPLPPLPRILVPTVVPRGSPLGEPGVPLGLVGGGLSLAGTFGGNPFGGLLGSFLPSKGLDGALRGIGGVLFGVIFFSNSAITTDGILTCILGGLLLLANEFDESTGTGELVIIGFAGNAGLDGSWGLSTTGSSLKKISISLHLIIIGWFESNDGFCSLINAINSLTNISNFSGDTLYDGEPDASIDGFSGIGGLNTTFFSASTFSGIGRAWLSRISRNILLKMYQWNLQ